MPGRKRMYLPYHPYHIVQRGTPIAAYTYRPNFSSITCERMQE